MAAKLKLGSLAHGSLILRTTLTSVSAFAPTSCTSNAAGLTGLPWTIGSKQNQKFVERRSPAPSRNRLGNGENLDVDRGVL
jgi:hypothetical protein